MRSDHITESLFKMNIVHLLLKCLAPVARRFELQTKDPICAQKKILFEYLRRNKNTEYGKKYKFSSIRSIEDFQERVPFSNYENLRLMVERMAAGAKNVLTADRPVFFGRTSGTTGKPKLIPVTRYSRNKKAQLMALWTYYISRDHPGTTSGKVFVIIDPEVKLTTKSGIPCGPENGHAYVNLPAIIKRGCAIPYEIFEIEGYNARYYTILRIAIEHDVTTLATLNPSAIIILCQKIKRWKDRIIDDIEKGTLDQNFDIPERIRAIAEKRLKPNPTRARELRRILNEKGELLPKDFWPNLKLIECWKGGTMRLYLEGLDRYFGQTPIRDFGCLSTETRSSIPITDEGAGGILAINTNFYEFIPKEDMHKAERRAVLCDRLEKDKEYLLIVTTPGGLYRYDTDDVIRVDGFFNKTPVIEFMQKGLNAISLSGEKVYESHINEAINAANKGLKLVIKFFSASVQMEKPPRYIFLVEFTDDPSLDKKKALLRSIEDELCLINLEYEDTRQRQELNSPILKVARKDEFEKFRSKRVAEGAHETQFKIPQLVRDPEFQKNFIIEEEIFLE
ncbi:MAG: GH3 auxin-responsive promoter family protein [Candidatus Omnitrophica bacterium]|nr:GH3 auxin-responsive promoter family protein [Candidatus Omnitrophota bacterium]MBU1808816.1 GH3 auxin-responsive promoter family protein [Candidatus Omnitrophota bacterium]